MPRLANSATPTQKERSNAPRYRAAGPASSRVCATCRFASGKRCGKHSFTFDADHLCDDWRPDIAAERARRTSIASGGSEKATGSLEIFKDANKQWRWTTVSSTAFRDRDGEIVSMQALEQAVAIKDATNTSGGDVDRGPLRWWHLDGVDVGRCDFQLFSGKSLIESGTFDDEAIAAAVALVADDLEISIGFLHPASEPDENGVFKNIEIVERSILPRGRASNLFTSLSVKGTNKMSSNLLKISKFADLLGHERAAAILEAAEANEKAAESSGVAFKESAEPAIDLASMNADELAAYAVQLKEKEEAAKKSALAETTVTVDFDADALLASVKEIVESTVAEALEGITAASEKAADAVASRIVAVENAVVDATDRLAALEGEQPRAAKTYRASTATDSVVDDDSGVAEKGAQKSAWELMGERMEQSMSGYVNPAWQQNGQ